MRMATTRGVNKEAVAKCIEYIENNYTFKDYLVKNGIYNNPVTQGADTLITCPWHTDAYPSLSISEDGKKKFKCFSCNRAGNFIQFMLAYNNEILGTHYTVYTLVEHILRNNASMQLATGLTTIYENIFARSKEVAINKPKIKLNIDVNDSLSYINLAKKMVKMKCSTEQAVQMITFMQAGLSPKEIYDEIFNPSPVEQQKKENIDLSKLLN